MKIEIAVEGPLEALLALQQRLPEGWQSPEPIVDHDPQRARLIRIEEDDRVNEILIRISEIAERQLSKADELEFRVRNLAYSEPSPWCESLRNPFPILPCLAVQPWSPSVSPVADPDTILLDSNLAFGTGKHPTTLLCLDAIYGLSRGSWGLAGKSVLDFGCGTALVAIAAAKLGASRCQGVEIDLEAAATARKNVMLNDLSGRVVICQGSWEAVEGNVDLIVANLVPSVLFGTGSEIPAHLTADGRAVVSGFGPKQCQEMEDFFAPLGLRPEERLDRDGWCALVLHPIGCTTRREAS
jgi:ribosomal protein L11 methyltransferase